MKNYHKAITDILNQLPKDKRRTGLHGDLERYTTNSKDIYTKEQRRLNKELGIKNINYK